MAEAEKVPIQIPMEQATKAIPLYDEWSRARDALLEENRKIVDYAIRTTEMRTGFYDKLALLAAGSFALSLTFVASLHKHASQELPLAALGSLKAGWVLMLVCILLSWYHNLYRCASVERLSIAGLQTLVGSRFVVTQTFMSRASSVFKDVKAEDVNLGEFFELGAAHMKQLSKDSVEQVEKFVKDATRISRHADTLGSLALLSLIVAFILLIRFAIKNIGLL